MRCLYLVGFIAVLASSTFAQDPIEAKDDGSAEGGWVVAIPAGSSDYFNVRYDASPGALCQGVSISVADFGAVSSYPRVGIYDANFALDPTGNTPDLAAVIGEVFSPPVLGSPLFTDFLVGFGLGSNNTPAYHVAAQFPPGDSGLLGIGADTDLNSLGGSESPGSPNPADSSGFTTDGYSTVSIFPFGAGDFGLRRHQLLTFADGGVFRLHGGGLAGDHVTYTTQGGEGFGTYLAVPDLPGGTEVCLLFLSAIGFPIQPVGPVLPLTTPSDGSSHSTLRLNGTFPPGLGNLTINFVCVAGSLGVAGSVFYTNEVTIHTLPDPIIPDFGCYDDGTYETGWVVSIPSGSSDYFNVNHGDAAAAGITGINGQRLAVMDFGTSVSAYPMSGKTRENTGVDPTGNTPDLASPYVTAPFPFPPLTFVTTSGQMVPTGFGTFVPTTPNLHGVVQFPLGDSGLLAIGGDTNSTFISGLSGWTLDGYSTPSNLFGVNWGMCCDGF